MFNPNELILEKVRAVEEYDISSHELLRRYTQIESPSLKTSADGKSVTDAMGAEIATFYEAQTGTFDFTNSLLSLDLAASQFGSEKEIASETSAMITPVVETIEIAADSTVTLKYVPVGTEGAEIKFVKLINANNTFGEKYELSATAGAGKFTLDAENKTITMPAGVTGRVIVNYKHESTAAVKVTKTTDSVPETIQLRVHVLFHDPCNENLVYSGTIDMPRAQIDPSSVEIGLTSDGKHAASYKLKKEYCAEQSKLFDIIVEQD